MSYFYLKYPQIRTPVPKNLDKEVIIILKTWGIHFFKKFYKCVFDIFPTFHFFLHLFRGMGIVKDWEIYFLSGGVVQAVGCTASKRKALSSNTTTIKKQQKRKKNLNKHRRQWKLFSFWPETRQQVIIWYVKSILSQVHAYNLSYLGSRDQEDSGLKAVQANSSQDPISIIKYPNTRKGWGGAQGVGPELKPQYCTHTHTHTHTHSILEKHKIEIMGHHIWPVVTVCSNTEFPLSMGNPPLFLPFSKDLT
jgi:hypothetical protein